MSHKVFIEDTQEEYRCREDQHLLAGMEALGS